MGIILDFKKHIGKTEEANVASGISGGDNCFINAENLSDDLVCEIRDVRNQIAQTECWFNMEKDSDLIDSCIYQKNMLDAKYKYLINRAKIKYHA